MHLARIRHTALTAVVLAVLPATGSASSFQILEQSPSLIGTAFSGTASRAEDATTVFFNPAGMARLDGASTTLGGNVIIVDSEFDNEGSTAGSGTSFERPLPGSEDNTDAPGLVPNFYYVSPLGERWTFGFGINAPFGLASEYDEDWQGRYHATESSLATINVNPTVSYEATDDLALGVGVSYQYADVTLKNEIDSFNACSLAAQDRGQSESQAQATCATAHGGPGNPSADSSVEIEGDDSDVIVDLSLHWTPTDRTAVGITWRQGPEYTLSGEADFSQSTSCAQDPFCSGALDAREGDIDASAEFPDTVTVSASHRFNETWTVHGDLAWTEWSVLQDIPIENTETGDQVSELELNYDDTFRYAVGASYRASETMTWRLGTAYDEAPQESPGFVTPRIPDADRFWTSVGLNYTLSENASLDFGYAHLFVDDVSIDNKEQGNTLKGEFEASIDIFTVQGNWRF